MSHWSGGTPSRVNSAARRLRRTGGLLAVGGSYRGGHGPQDLGRIGEFHSAEPGCLDHELPADALALGGGQVRRGGIDVAVSAGFTHSVRMVKAGREVLLRLDDGVDGGLSVVHVSHGDPPAVAGSRGRAGRTRRPALALRRVAFPWTGT